MTHTGLDRLSPPPAPYKVFNYVPRVNHYPFIAEPKKQSTMARLFALSLFQLLLAFAACVSAGDPDMLQDLCVADLSSGNVSRAPFFLLLAGPYHHL